MIRFEHVSKTYPNGTVALSDVGFSVAAGTIHAICGENGAGKSTLMKILSGLELPSAGSISINGEPVRPDSPRAAAALGIGMVHQHFSLIGSLTVTENILLGQEPRRGPFVDRAKARARVLDLAARYSLDVDPDAKLATLSVAAQQKVEILKALSRDTRILILDEPTAVLSPPETEELFRRLVALRESGLTILFISHKLKEVRALAQQVTTLRAGRVSGDAPMSAISDDEIARLVMGEAGTSAIVRPEPQSAEARITVRGLTLRARDANDRLDAIDLAIRPGEILGIAGVDGSGQRGLVKVLTGACQPDAGMIAWDGKSVAGANTGALRRRGLAHLPADRFRDGGSRRLTLTENALAGAHRNYRFGPLLKPRAMIETTRGIIDRFAVRCPGPLAPLGALSGGNAQKIIAAREFGSNPRFLIVDQPTRGIDVAAANFIQDQIVALARSGCAVLLLSADLDELLRLSTRIVVLYAGRIVASLPNDPELTPARLGPFMLGLEVAA
ncbi:ABC transporter ATP-binding protein [Kaistia dalseonensis]|uniref:Simple sugar transport system ATP-binding protein n=1 Tax=Kaistia dalseonensis TaxID=410840 RepID=A0ABU0H446_9HYPH|nr:ABC transporter ATP-binding protein [Kaistia dalseonensis]MDQ0437075.1 simple sugar transport system ATP-binding protein [Kaistia dalseonensis]